MIYLQTKYILYLDILIFKYVTFVKLTNILIQREYHESYNEKIRKVKNKYTMKLTSVLNFSKRAIIPMNHNTFGFIFVPYHYLDKSCSLISFIQITVCI